MMDIIVLGGCGLLVVCVMIALAVAAITGCTDRSRRSESNKRRFSACGIGAVRSVRGIH